VVGLSLRRAGVTGLSFEGRGERIAKGFYIPVLKESVEYDRATSYFSVARTVARRCSDMVARAACMLAFWQ
jgi:hypothetical protein